MYKIAVLGDRDSIAGFASLGLTTFEINEGSEADATIRKLSTSGYAVIYITEALAALIPETVDRYRSARMPAIILIPGITGNTGVGMADLHKSVEKAVGSDILSKK